MKSHDFIIILYKIKNELKKNGDVIQDEEFESLLNKIRLIENTNFIDFSVENKINKIIDIINFLLKKDLSPKSISYLKDKISIIGLENI